MERKREKERERERESGEGGRERELLGGLFAIPVPLGRLVKEMTWMCGVCNVEAPTGIGMIRYVSNTWAQTLS